MKKLTQIFILLFLIWNITPMKAQKYYDQQWKKISENYKKVVDLTINFKNNYLVCLLFKFKITLTPLVFAKGL